MKKNLKKCLENSVLLFLCIFLTVTLSCNGGNTLDLTKPLYSVSKPVYKSSLEDSSCLTGGVYFELYNRAYSDITQIETCMNVYDRKEKKLLSGKTIITKADIVIPKKSSQKLCISLDDYITGFGEGGFYIDQFYVSLIVYSDGRKWKDSFGIYAVSGGE